MKILLIFLVLFWSFGTPLAQSGGPVEGAVRVQLSRAIQMFQTQNWEGFGQLFIPALYPNEYLNSVFRKYRGCDFIILSTNYGSSGPYYSLINAIIQFRREGRLTPKKWVITMVSDPTSPTRWKIQRFRPINHTDRKFFSPTFGIPLYRPKFILNGENPGKTVEVF